MTLQAFLELRGLAAIAHHVPGRIRLKLDPRILQHPAASAMLSLSSGKPEAGLHSARLNILARSLVLEYAPERILPEDLDNFFTGTDMPELHKTAEKIARILGIELRQQP